MHTLHDPAVRAELRTRLARLTPDARPRWGKLDAPSMVAHLTEAARMGLGELVCVPKGPALLRSWPVRMLVVYVVPFPKSAPTAKELIARRGGALPEELRQLDAALERFAAAPPDREPATHPAFGRLTRRQWGVLGYKHADHHLRQFGL